MVGLEMNKIVSVIVPVYRVEHYLNRAVDSILNQTYQHLDIILVDDGSPDRCGEICDEYAVIDSRVRVIHKSNGGLSSARNAGLEIANGEYVLFVDSDDFIQAHMVERLLGVIEKEKFDIVQCSFFRFASDIPQERLTDQIEIVSKYDALKRIDEAVYMAAWNKIYKKDLFADIRFPEGKIHEDVGCTYKLFFDSEGIAVISDELYGYYVNPDSITTSKIKENKLDLLDVYAEQMEFFQKRGLKCFAKRSANNLAASFGTLLSYPKERYENYDVFLTLIQNKFIILRKLLLRRALRPDLYFSVLLSFGNVKFMKLCHKIKTRRKKQVGRGEKNE